MPGFGLGLRPSARRRQRVLPDLELVVSPYGGTASGLWTITAAAVNRNGSTSGQAAVGLDRLLVAGANYRVRFLVSDKSGDDFFFRLGGGGTAHQIVANGQYDAVVPAGGTNQVIAFAPWAGTAGQATITGLSVQAA